jgi:hypothetical protein
MSFRTGTTTMLARALWALALVGFATAAWAQMAVEVIPLRHRTAEEVIPIIQPMLVRDASVSGLRGQLVVRTTRSNLEDIRRILASIDVAARRLQITVAQDVAADGTRRGAEISGTVREGDARLNVPGTGPTPRDGVQARVYSNRSMENLRVLQTVQVLEGRSAYVQAGQSVPLPERRVTRSVIGGRVVEQVVEGAEYRNVDTGFYVSPRVSGDRVTLDISSQREALTPGRPGAVDVQRATTTVSGRLGEWIEVAGSSEERSTEREVLLGRAGGTRTESRSVLLRVDEIR